MPEFRGVDQFARLARDLRLAGNVELLKRMRAGLAKAVRPAGGLLRESAAATLPSGYGGPVLAPSLSVRADIDAGFHTARASVKAHARGNPRRRDIPRINAGVLAHPVHGHRGRWVRQNVTPGFWDRPAAQLADSAYTQMQGVLDDIANLIAKG